MMNLAAVGLFLISTLWGGTVIVVDPVPPPNAVTGGTVVAALQIVNGAVNTVTTLHGEEPFLAAANAALSGWRFPDRNEGTVLVVVNFREPNFHSMGQTTERLSSKGVEPSLPYPTLVAQPPYPANAIESGTAVVRLNIRANGSIGETQVVEGAGAFAQASVDTVKKWRFSPATNSEGRKTSSEVFAVFVFRAPVLSPRD